VISAGEWVCPICEAHIAAFEVHTHDTPASVLIRAIEAAEDRKLAATGQDIPGVYAADQYNTRALFSGFGIGHEELGEIAARAARMFCQLAHTEPLERAFLTCWCDALLVGLLAREIDRQDIRT
jgi:hypothetical protein